MQKSPPSCTSLCTSTVIFTFIFIFIFISTLSSNTADASFFSSNNNNNNNNNNNHNNYNYNNNYKRVRLQDVQVLTFVAGEMTTARRSSPVPQMSCVGGSARCHSDLLPSAMQCRNVGSDGIDVQWKCDAEVDNSVRLGRTTVSCEGYEYPDDPFILAGSCGVEYTLESTGDYSSRHGYYAGGSRHQPSSGGNHLFLIIVLGVLAYQLYKWCSFGANRHGGDPLDRNRWGGPHGGYNGGPPPGYPGGPGGPGGPSCSPPPYSSVNPNTGGGWNFWHGFGLGGVLGALFAPRRNYGYGNAGYGYGGYGTRPGWGSGYRTQHNTGYNGGFGSSSGGTHTSTGFGGTRRR